ncbi:MAG TPA: GNAT family N-acetyltransferase [Candidatus Limnocylindrales bacterium]
MAEASLEIGQVVTLVDVEDAGELLRAYASWVLTLTAGMSEVPTFHGLDEELATLPGIYAPPAGRLLLARLDERPAGTIALKPHDAGTAEIKRLYVRPDCRGHEIGRRLVETVVAEARASRYRRLVLDSHVSMTSAHRLYADAGFRRVGVPDDFPEDLRAVAIFMEADLDAVPAS